MGSPEKPIDVELGKMGSGAGDRNGQKVEEIGDENAPLKFEMELETNESRFTGLKKQELMEIANKPQWRRARMILFVLFWVLWVGMLAAAILIVINAPKCKPVPTTQWYQDTVLYKVDPNRFSASQDYKGVMNHMKYVKDMKSTMLVSNVMGEDMDEVLGDQTSFEDMVKSAHENHVKVIVELKVDALSTSSKSFETSKKCTPEDDDDDSCQLFKWSETEAEGTVQSTSATRKDAYYVGDAESAAVNYQSQYAHQYLKGSMGKWMELNVDGFYISDLSKVDDKDKVLETAWNTVKDEKTEDDLPIALFAEALGSMNDLFELNEVYKVPGNQTNGAALPSIVYPTDAGSASGFVASVQERREKYRSIPAHINNADSTGNETDREFAITLLNLALPGTPLLQMGEEIADANASFTWKDSQSSAPLESNEYKFELDSTREMVKRRCANTLSLHSLRYDTRDNDTTFYFADTGSKNVVAFCRKWYKKPGVFVISNLGADEVEFSLDWNKCDENLLKSGQVVISSSESFARKSSVKDLFKNTSEDEDLNDKAFTLPAYTTLVLSG